MQKSVQENILIEKSTSIRQSGWRTDLLILTCSCNMPSIQVDGINTKIDHASPQPLLIPIVSHQDRVAPARALHFKVYFKLHLR